MEMPRFLWYNSRNGGYYTGEMSNGSPLDGATAY